LKSGCVTVHVANNCSRQSFHSKTINHNEDISI
jgi:hypothetical protein